MARKVIRKRQMLVIAVAVAQAICLIWGLFGFGTWLKASIRKTIHAQILADNVETAKHLTSLIRHLDVQDLRDNRSSWGRLQEAIREIRLPNDGFVCVLDAADGALLCHPELSDAPSHLFSTGDLGASPDHAMVKPGMQKPAMNKTAAKPAMVKPAMVKPAMNKPAMSKPGMVKPAMVKPAMNKPAMNKPAMNKPAMRKPAMRKPAMVKASARPQTGQASPASDQPMPDKKPMVRKASLSNATPGEGRVTGEVVYYGGELQIVAAGFIPELNANVNVHQKAAGIEKAIARITKPIVPIGLAISLGLIVVSTAAVVEILRRYENRLAAINENLEALVDKRTRALRKTRDAIIFGLAKLAESRDTDTGEHLERIRIYVTILAKHLSKKYDWIDDGYIENLALASSLHDIGKVGIPDRILLKPGRFDPDEREVMETHAALGGDCLAAISDRLGEDDFLQLSRQIAYGHHEKWDGTGYPNGVCGNRIPIAARIVALADVYDALRSRRPYKNPMPHLKAKQILEEGRGTHFDPEVLDAFLASESEFERVSTTYDRLEVAVEPPSQNAQA